MNVAIVGANGNIGRLLAEQLKATRSFEPVALIRNAEQAAWFAEREIETRLMDLEGEFAPALDGADAVVFAAGSGGHTGKDKTLLIDLWGAVRVAKHCEEIGPKRYVMVSAIHATNPDGQDSAIKPYLVAKWAADEYLRNSDLAYTILQPGSLTNDPATGMIKAARQLPKDKGSIARADVAASIVHCLKTTLTVGKSYEMLSGDTPIAEALV